MSSRFIRSALTPAVRASPSRLTTPQWTGARRAMYSTGPGARPMQSGGSTLYWTVGLLAAGATGAYFLNSPPGPNVSNGPWATEYYQKVYNAIAAELESNPDYDDGSYAPVLLRLAWHAAGTFDRETLTGGSNGATMRFKPESAHGANNGLEVAREYMDRVKRQFPDMSYSDFWSLGGVVAVQEMGGPTIPWRPGRTDGMEQQCTPDGRLPDAAQGSSHIRDIFYRMGFNDQEIVALIGAHALGRCHRDRSGFDGPWTFSPTTFTNDFYTQLLQSNWQERSWNGPKQYEDKETKSLMMLPADMALRTDKDFRPWVELYAKDEERFFKDFATAFQKLEELGVNFPSGTPEYRFKRTE
ncbi:MAG: peroxidase [Piptocephalis tieghemiana]|nr:MAG: peroxidase [Piptocephalis tieghemiana]